MHHGICIHRKNNDRFFLRNQFYVERKKRSTCAKLELKINMDSKQQQKELGSSFSKSSCKEPRPVFREITDEELLRDEEEEINSGVKVWSRDISLLPAVSHKLMRDYLIDGTIDLDKRSRGADKHKVMGYPLFKENYVKKDRVKANVKAENTLFIIKCFVAAAMKKEKYNVYIHLHQTSGEILYAKCSCKAGAGGCCKHVSAALYQLVEYRELNLKSVPEDKTCTDLLQKWHVPGEAANTEAILFSDLIFEKADFEKDKSNTRKRPIVTGSRKYCSAPNSHETSEQLQSFCDNLKKTGQGDYMVSLLEGNNYVPSDFYHSSRKDILAGDEDWEPETKRQAVSNIFEQFTSMTFADNLLNESNKTFVLNHLMIPSETCVSIEKSTLQQSENVEWFNERRKRLTSSNFGAVINRRANIFPKTIIKKVLCSNKFNKIPQSCKWGLDNEPRVVEQYKKLQNVKVEKCGLVINPKWPWLGCSPDGIVNEKAIEIKCPFSKKDLTIIEACADKSFFCTLENDQPKLKRTHVYYFQCQGIMAITGLQEIDFIVYTNKGLNVETIKFDERNWNLVWLPKLTEFYFEFISKSLFSGN